MKIGDRVAILSTTNRRRMEPECIRIVTVAKVTPTQQVVVPSATGKSPGGSPARFGTCARYSGCLAMASLLGSVRRYHLARTAAALASSLDFLQGTFEKIHLQSLLCQELLQEMDFFAVSRCVRAGPRRFVSWLNALQLPAPLVEAPPPYPEFSCQRLDIFTGFHAFNGHALKFPGIPFPLHLWFLSRKLCPFLCASSRVHSSTFPSAL